MCRLSDTRPPMLDRTDFASWQQRIRLNRRCPQQLGPERARVYSDLSPEDKDRYNADIQATNILLQGLPKDIYTIINHYTEAKYIWDNVKMLLEGSELTKKDRESQLSETEPRFDGTPTSDQLYAYQKQNEANANENKKIIAHDNGVALDEEHCLFIVGGQDTAVNEDVESNQELPTATTKYHGKFLSSAYPAFDEASPSYVPTFNLRAQLRGSPEEIAEITRKKMNNKMKDPRKQLTPKQIFWSKDLIKMKAEALKEQTHKIFSDQQSDDYAILQIHLKACPQGERVFEQQKHVISPRTPTEIGDPTFHTLRIRLFSNADVIHKRPLAFWELRATDRLLKTYEREFASSVEASKRRRSLLNHKIQQLSKGSSEGSSIILEVPDEPKDNSEVAEKQAGNVQTSLTLSSAKLEIQSM
ncbi:hypothetical protein Tco_0127903 [Tanacetum coccineum]